MDKLFLLSVIVLFGISCSTNRVKMAQQVREADRKKIDSELTQEMSLKQDRADLDKLRQGEPAQKKKEADELALFLNLMFENKDHPAAVRDRFNALVERKRSDFRTKTERLRDDFRRRETREREDFLSSQGKKRESFLSGRHDSKSIQRFSADQERDRIRYFADERDRRQSFETELNVKSKDFESYMRERQNQFNEQYRLYSKQFSERPKESKAVTGEDFQRMEELPSTPLEPGN